jgi:hypothetical protein
MQASYRLWQTHCVPQCERASEQVSRCWADASLEDIAINRTQTVAIRTARKIKRVMTSCAAEPTAARGPATFACRAQLCRLLCYIWHRLRPLER